MVAKTHTILMFIGHFPHKSRIISGSFAENDIYIPMVLFLLMVYVNKYT